MTVVDVSKGQTDTSETLTKLSMRHQGEEYINISWSEY